MEPQGRRSVDIGRLQKALPLYVEMVSKGWEVRDLVGRRREDWGEEVLLDWDQETIRRAVHDLDKLFVAEP